jgi:hypothetical protein
MSRTRSLCVSLELEFDDGRVTGRLEDEKGKDWRFSSWLDLLALIERMPAGASSPDDLTWKQRRLEET